MKTSQQLLRIAGILTFGVAIFQAVIGMSPDWSRYFGAGDDLVKNSWILFAAGLFVASLFAICGLYALSAIGKLRRLPLLKAGLITITIVFLIRGISLIPEVLVYTGKIKSVVEIPTQNLFSSGVALLIGILYLVGTIGSWSVLPVKQKQ